ncbi:hypothetical protein L1987_54918 [Smallanthus sonchifolius]|uniref:Uncharacterized protein n=1 Tax=Smallanthus sonchifolius TaxID=185202 RepID=A0ACB9E7Z0_9ASTR|nr:hypothetical protein L1987_54918 [Smallanthus sonchifolius]
MIPLSLSIILLPTYAVLCSLDVARSSNEVDALLKWKATLHSLNTNVLLPSWTHDHNLNFSAIKTVSPCNWYGVSCDDNGRVNRLNLSSSSLTGTLDHLSFYSFPNLMYLELSLNNFYGIIPSKIGHLSNLVYLDLSANHFTGIIPPEIGELRNLVTLHLFQNKLTGSIPQGICQMSFLSGLALSQNNLYGSIPTCLGQLSNLSYVHLNRNNISGTIPQEFRNLYRELKYIVLLRLYSNKLSGPIRRELGNLTSLSNLQLGKNQLNGPIPSSFGNLQTLEKLYLHDNQLSGSIPPELGKLKLVEIEITNNRFSGSLPDEICKGRKLEYLLVGNNKLTGGIPKSLYNCSSLIRVRFDGNQITGDVSESSGVYPHLNYINLNDNQVYGEISDNWSKCKNLTTIQMGGNRIRGNIPPSLGKSIQLENINLSSNDLVGEIPKELGRLTRMGKLVLSNNQLSGVLPQDLGSLGKLLYLDMSMNMLKGSIPSSLEHCSKLDFLNFSNNGFTGEIPVQFGRLVQLSVLDLSYNSFIKEIPSGLSSPLPESKCVINLTIEVLQGNEDLCGNVRGLRQCATESSTPNRKHLLALVISLSLLGAFLLGCEIVAVKRLRSSSDVTKHNVFLNEITTLTRIRHRNIVKLLGYCSHAQISFLIYKYLEGGSLAAILCDRAAENLDWTKRLNIIKGVAYALSYMHHDCLPAIIHCDISSKNILLDSEYEACVSDFGTSKILKPNSSNWSNIGGTVGYLAPEIAYTMKVTEKCDVYSFDIDTSKKEVNLTDLLDHRLLVPLPKIKVAITSILMLAYKCINSNPDIRPTMYEVSQNIVCIISDMYKRDDVV